MPERVGSAGEIVTALDEAATADLIAGLADNEVEAVAVCLLWSTVNPAHELRVGELLEQHLPGVPYTLSHALNPIAARVPPRLVRRDRRVAEAADDALPGRRSSNASETPD